MQAVLGIDAAWTTKNPSGLALVVNSGLGWTLRAKASSYSEFHRLAHEADWPEVPSLPPAHILLKTARALAGGPIGTIAVDMPLALAPITRRRTSDNEVSRKYGSRYCSTHSPSSDRPGKISDDLRQGFADAGYALAVSKFTGHALIEVYPHPALLELANAGERLRYKFGNIGKYWSGEPGARRRELLFDEWGKIVQLLDGQISGVANALPLPPIAAPSREMKAFEDVLDAVVCAWVGVCALEGRARPLGDNESAIWIPLPSSC